MTTLQIIEGRPVYRPTPAIGLGTTAPAIDFEEAIWGRIEAWIAWRWGERPALFIVEGGCGSWRAPLCPFTAETTEAWTGDAWEPVTLPPDPLGGVKLGAASYYRIAGLLGSDDELPEDVAEAYRRLATYSLRKENHPGESSWSEEIGVLKDAGTRAPTWLARAMAWSGAADLLRPYRRAP